MKDDYQMFPIVLGIRSVSWRLEAFPVFSKEAHLQSQNGVQGCTGMGITNVHLMWSLIKRWIYISISALIPTSYKDHQTLRLISSIKSRRKGKERRGKEKTAYLWRHILCVFLGMVLQIEEKTNSLSFARNVFLEWHCTCSQKSIFQIEI